MFSFPGSKSFGAILRLTQKNLTFPYTSRVWCVSLLDTKHIGSCVWDGVERWHKLYSVHMEIFIHFPGCFVLVCCDISDCLQFSTMDHKTRCVFSSMSMAKRHYLWWQQIQTSNRTSALLLFSRIMESLRKGRSKSRCFSFVLELVLASIHLYNLPLGIHGLSRLCILYETAVMWAMTRVTSFAGHASRFLEDYLD